MSSSGSPAIEVSAGSPAGNSNGVPTGAGDASQHPLLFYVNVPFPLGVYLLGSQLAVPTKDALGPVGMYRENTPAGENPACFMDLLKDYLSGLFGMPPEAVFPLYGLNGNMQRAPAGADPMAPYSFVTLEAFLLLLFTKVPTNLTSMDSSLKKQTTDFIRKSLNVMTSFLQVKMPPGAGAVGGAPLLPIPNESIRSYMTQFMAAANAAASGQEAGPGSSQAPPPPLLRIPPGSGAADNNNCDPASADAKNDMDHAPVIADVTSNAKG